MSLQWVLIRGLTREAGHWGGFPDALTRTFPGSRVETMDLLGAGTQFKVSAPISIGAYVEALHEELQSKRAATGARRILVTLSMAAMVALEWMKRYPKDFEGAVLINGSASAVSPIYRRLRPSAFPQLLKVAATWEESNRERAILDLTSNVREAADAAHPSWVTIARERPVSLPNALRQLLAAALFRPPRVSPAARLLFLNSTEDRMVHFSCSTALHRTYGGELQTHVSAGHDLPLDAPDWVVDRIHSWLG